MRRLTRRDTRRAVTVVVCVTATALCDLLIACFALGVNFTDVDDFISHRIPLDEVNHGFDLMEHQDGVRSVIQFS